MHFKTITIPDSDNFRIDNKKLRRSKRVAKRNNLEEILKHQPVVEDSDSRSESISVEEFQFGLNNFSDQGKDVA